MSQLAPTFSGAIWDMFVALSNLKGPTVTVLPHPTSANQTFLLSDEDDLSSAELLRRTVRALGRPARLIPAPAPVMQGALTLLGRKGLAERRLGSLQVDISHTRRTLSWTPPVRVDDALAEAVEAPLEKEGKS